ncbi:Protein-lysine N-methyltransferase EFM6 [Cladobotryum mycophilum]|uniref:Protein-lysine N-methyltransferase EFM6 n=1 Tax=Cladobotryum mycophilum TaxID=491253 RepID=A0ABR0SJM9_9HYPO
MESPSSSPPLNPVAGVSEDLVSLPNLKAAGDTNIDFDGQLSHSIKLHEDVRTGCGGQTWPAGMVLGKHMLRYHRAELEHARILELGAGGGLVGLAVASGCSLQSRLVLTDQDPMLELMKYNIQLNDLDSKAEALVLNWGEALPEYVVAQKPNVVLAAECVYFEPAFPLLMETLKDLFALNAEAVVYFCFKKRRRADMQFVKMAKKAFQVEEIFDEDRPVFQRQALFLFTFRSRAAKGNTAKKGGADAASNKPISSES